MSEGERESFMSLESMMQNFVPGQRGRKPAPALPVIRDSDGNVIPRYLTEKHLGVRRENGAMKLKKLTNRHLKIVGMHLEGASVEMIASNCNCTISTVSRILNDPLAQQILKRVYSDREGEVQALGGKALQAVRDGLDKQQPINTRLRAVSSYAKVREVMMPKDKGSESAEDVIARMLAAVQINGGNVQMNFNIPTPAEEK